MRKDTLQIKRPHQEEWNKQCWIFASGVQEIQMLKTWPWEYFSWFTELRKAMQQATNVAYCRQTLQPHPIYLELCRKPQWFRATPPLPQDMILSGMNYADGLVEHKQALLLANRLAAFKLLLQLHNSPSPPSSQEQNLFFLFLIETNGNFCREWEPLRKTPGQAADRCSYLLLPQPDNCYYMCFLLKK